MSWNYTDNAGPVELADSVPRGPQKLDSGGLYEAAAARRETSGRCRAPTKDAGVGGINPHGNDRAVTERNSAITPRCAQGARTSLGRRARAADSPPVAPATLKGKRFGRWLVIAPKGRDRYGGRMWECRCDCGVIRTVRETSLRSGQSRSCGCLHAELLAERAKIGRYARKHGMYATPEYQSWHLMKWRCGNPSAVGYQYYGGRGISVCREWLESFETFYCDMGPRPTPKHSIDRIDNDGNYEPGNCRWATAKEQAHNRRNNHVITFNGETLCATEWSDRLGGGRNVVSRRIKKGWSPEKAISTPLMSHREAGLASIRIRRERGRQL